MPLLCRAALLLLVTLLTWAGSAPLNDEKCHVFITVASHWFKSSVKNDGLQGLQTRQLEVNWDTASCGSKLHKVFLFSEDPRSANFSSSSNFLDSVICAHHPQNFYRTNVTLGRPKLPGGWDKKTILNNEAEKVNELPTPGDHCLPYWIAAYDAESNILAVECLRIRPTWMGDLKSQIGNARLSQLMIPGTHNSGCFYGKDIESRGDVLYRFTRTQDEDVWEQLVWGARYIDLRVGFYKNKKEQFWVNHAQERITELRPVLKDVARFLRMSPHEVVIVDFHRFPVGFSGKFQQSAVRHRWLANMINEELGQLAAQCVYLGSPRLSDLWHRGKRAVVYHAKRLEVHVNWNDDWLCGPMTQAWGDEQHATQLHEFLDNMMGKHTGRSVPWAAMAELTPKYTDVIMRPQRGLRMMADEVNRALTYWFKHLWWKDANVVATDFLLGSKIVDVAVEANDKRFPAFNNDKSHYSNF